MNNHVWLEKRVTTTDTLLSPEDERKIIRELLGKQFDHAGKLFKPDNTFYELADNENLQQSARQLFMWLGIKPGHIEIKYSQLPQPGIYTEDPGIRRIIINQKLSAHPFQCASVLTHLVMHSVLAGKRRILLSDPVENEMFTNLAIVESGMALAAINGLSPIHIWQKLRLNSDINPVSFFPGLDIFMKNFEQYIEKYHIHHGEYAAYLAPWVNKFLPNELNYRPAVKNSQPEFITNAVSSKHRLIIKTVLIGIIAAAVLIAGYFAFTGKSQDLTAEQLHQLEQISRLKNDYESCMDKLKNMRRELDHNDIYQEQIINSELANCTSLRNEHNSLVGRYNRSIGN